MLSGNINDTRKTTESEIVRDEDRAPERSIIVPTLVTFVITFVSTFSLVSLSGIYQPKVITEEERTVPAEGDCNVEVEAPMPYLRCGTAVQRFEQLRQNVKAGAGFDFLAKCGDMMRNKNSRSTKPGVSSNSKHKSGEAFDYNQEDARVLLVREPTIGGLAYWRTFLLCEKQDGTCGVKADLNTENAGRVSAYVFDFTAAAEGAGWERIPAQQGWESRPTKKEFWHYQIKENESVERASP